MNGCQEVGIGVTLAIIVGVAQGLFGWPWWINGAILVGGIVLYVVLAQKWDKEKG